MSTSLTNCLRCLAIIDLSKGLHVCKPAEGDDPGEVTAGERDAAYWRNEYATERGRAHSWEVDMRAKLTAAEAARDAAEKQLTALRAAATALVTKLQNSRVLLRSPGITGMGIAVDYDAPYSEELRALLALLPEAAPADGGGGEKKP